MGLVMIGTLFTAFFIGIGVFLLVMGGETLRRPEEMSNFIFKHYVSYSGPTPTYLKLAKIGGIGMVALGALSLGMGLLLLMGLLS